MRTRLLVLAILFLCASSAGAESWRLELDPAATRIEFELGATLHTVQGRLALRSGVLRFDPEAGSLSGRVVVDATSAGTDNSTRDSTMHEAVLRSADYPEIILHADALEVVERSATSLHGMLRGRIELLGRVHPLRIPIEANQLEAGRGRVSGSFPVPYVEWGLEDVSNFLLRVDPVVTLRFESEGKLSPMSQAGAPDDS